MTPEQRDQIASVRARWNCLSGLSDGAKIIDLRQEGWAEAAIQVVARRHQKWRRPSAIRRDSSIEMRELRAKLARAEMRLRQLS